ncbi:MAG: TonB-dependent receptor, partial [Bacteroidales bacterium]|nr:TonB-dependent receptor [Bacteroidales bacterium]
AVGYGVQKKATLTGSVASVESDFMENRPLTNTSQALQGINGLYVNQASGQPGADDATIRIRGVGTFNNNEPLVLVDGIEYSLRDINPNDIESISVLKDAASASIYGNRAANGVIIITTRKGKKGNLKVEYNGYFGWQQATYLPDMVTNSVDYMMARNLASENEGQPKPYSDAQIEEFRNGADPDLYPNTDWHDILFSTAPINEHNIRLSGGSENATYLLSVGYLDQNGVLIATGAKRYSITSNVTYKYSQKLLFGANINGSFWDRNQPVVDVPTFVLTNVNRSLPIHPNILSDGRYGDTWLITPGHNVFRHPVAVAEEGFQNNKTQRALINLFGEYTLPFNIKYKANIGVTKFDAYDHRFIPEVNLYDPKKPDVPKVLRFDPPTRSVQRSNNNNMDLSFFQTLNWNWTDSSDKHNLQIMLGFSRESFRRSNFLAYIEGFIGNELTELNAGTINKDVGGTSNRSELMSYFGRANYNFSEKYLLEFNFRYDGSSRFARDHRWGFFPSVSAAWRVSEESLLSDIDAISDLKLRMSWGELGNQNISLYSFVNNININQGAIIGNSVVAGSAVTALADPSISWETTRMINLGLDLNLWNNMLIMNVDVFDKLTSDILARVNVPSQVGDLAGPITNLYSMSNKGAELSLSHLNSVGDFNYRIGGNIAFVNNKVKYMAGDEQYISNGYGNIRVIKEGYPIHSWYLYEALGLFQSEQEIEKHAFQHNATAPGDIKYRDINDDGKIDVEDMRVMGRSVPRFTYGINLGIDYKKFDLSAIFQGVNDIDIYPASNVAWPLFNGAGITKDQFMNSWTPENRDAKYPRLSLYKRGTQINARNSTFWLQDASYLRLKNLQFGYTFNHQKLEKFHLDKIRVYANAQNLLTISKYKLSDPEKDVLRENIGDYPNSKVFSIGCNVVF